MRSDWPGGDIETSVRSSADYTEQSKERSRKGIDFSRSEILVDNIVIVDVAILQFHIVYNMFIFARQMRYPERLNCVDILGSIPRWSCIRALDSLPTEHENPPGLLGIREELGSLCSETRPFDKRR